MTLALPRPAAPAEPLAPAGPLAALARIAADCRVVSADAFSCAGTTVHRPADAPVGGDAWLAPALAGRLYSAHYLGVPAAEDAAPDHRPAFVREDPELGRLLRQANACTEHWEPGWVTVGEDGADDRVVTRDGLRLHVTRDEVRPRDAAAGAPVEVRFPADRPFASPGFYLTVSSRGPTEPGEALVRWYVGVTPSAAPVLFGAMTSAMEHLGVRFVMKVLNDPAAYPRPDAAVLYVGRADVRRVAPAVLDVVVGRDVERLDRVPLFTRQVAAGLAIADDPPYAGHPLSFGQHRCSLVARGVVAAGPDSDPADRRAAVVDSFLAAGIDPARPHLNPGAPEFDLQESSWLS